MKRTGWFTLPTVALAMIGLALPQLRAADLPAQRPVFEPLPVPAKPAPITISDLALGEGGMLRGQVVDPQGLPLASVAVAVAQQERVVATARTDQNGHFAIRGLPGGVYQVSAAEGEAVYRLWAPYTAPPAAQPAALVVSGNQLVRSQGPGSGLRAFFTNPWVLAGMLGAALIIPIALNNRERVSTS